MEPRGSNWRGSNSPTSLVGATPRTCLLLARGITIGGIQFGRLQAISREKFDSEPVFSRKKKNVSDSCLPPKAHSFPSDSNFVSRAISVYTRLMFGHMYDIVWSYVQPDTKRFFRGEAEGCQTEDEVRATGDTCCLPTFGQK